MRFPRLSEDGSDEVLGTQMDSKECTKDSSLSPVLCVTITSFATINQDTSTTSIVYETSTIQLITSSTLLQVTTVTKSPVVLGPSSISYQPSVQESTYLSTYSSTSDASLIHSRRPASSPLSTQTTPTRPIQSTTEQYHPSKQLSTSGIVTSPIPTQPSQTRRSKSLRSQHPHSSDFTKSTSTNSHSVASHITYDHSSHTISHFYSHTAISSTSKSAETTKSEKPPPGSEPLHSTDGPEQSPPAPANPSKIYIGVFSALGGILAILILGCLIYSIHRQRRRKKKARDRRREDMPEISRPILPPEQYVPAGYLPRSAVARAPPPAIPPRSFSRPRRTPYPAAHIRVVPKRRSNGSDWSYRANGRHQRGWSNPFDME